MYVAIIFTVDLMHFPDTFNTGKDKVIQHSIRPFQNTLNQKFFFVMSMTTIG
jgi:hypothetical protein